VSSVVQANLCKQLLGMSAVQAFELSPTAMAAAFDDAVGSIVTINLFFKGGANHALAKGAC
jgi:hypothetical protein